MKMAALIPSPADYEVCTVVKFFNAQNMAPSNLRKVIQNKMRGMLSAGVVFLHDNARPHTAWLTTALLQQFCWEVFDHPPYSPDLTPSDFHLFLHLKKFLSGQHYMYHSDSELQAAVTHWFQTADFYDTGIQKLIPWYDKCLHSGGDYVQK